MFALTRRELKDKEDLRRWSDSSEEPMGGVSEKWGGVGNWKQRRGDELELGESVSQLLEQSLCEKTHKRVVSIRDKWKTELGLRIYIIHVTIGGIGRHENVQKLLRERNQPGNRKGGMTGDKEMRIVTATSWVFFFLFFQYYYGLSF